MQLAALPFSLNPIPSKSYRFAGGGGYQAIPQELTDQLQLAMENEDCKTIHRQTAAAVPYFRTFIWNHVLSSNYRHLMWYSNVLLELFQKIYMDLPISAI
jgi:hypothetical protein